MNYRKMLSAAAAVFLLGVAHAEQMPADCAVPTLQAKDGKVTVTEDGRNAEIDVTPPKATRSRAAAARTRCHSGGGYTICSNGRYGCVWSDRSGRLLGCGAGI